MLIDATMIRCFSECRESFRLNYCEGGTGLTSRTPSIFREYGIGLHSAVEAFWHGEPYERSLAVAMNYFKTLELSLLDPKMKAKFDTMELNTPEMLQVYYDRVECDPENLLCAEKEWMHFPDWPGFPTLCGRIDRVMKGPVLIDLKTATDMGGQWRSEYRNAMLRDVGLGMYDWYLCQIGPAPTAVKLEVLVKPSSYRGTEKPARLEIMDLPEITTPGYRKRFEQQLKMFVREITEYCDKYANVAPWPMATTHACTTKFGRCQFFDHPCNLGWDEKSRSKFKPRPEHLTVRGAK